MTECILWSGFRNPQGYGQTKIGGRTYLAHRAAYAESRGLDVATMGGHVIHSCDNPPCINPAHLTLATHAINMADKVRKGRQACGTKHAHSKLTEAQVLEIRRRFQPGCPVNGGSALGREFGVAHSQVSRAARAKSWCSLHSQPQSKLEIFDD